jgi:hypothetical protein
MYPLRFEPVYQYRIWGGRRLASLLKAPLPGDGPIGEAWLMSERDDHPSKVADGPLNGRTIRQSLDQSPEQLLGSLAGRFRRFLLLLRFLDASKMVSVQVHPSDLQTEYLPAGESGETEAAVVLEAGSESLIYAGLRPDSTVDVLRRALADKSVANRQGVGALRGASASDPISLTRAGADAGVAAGTAWGSRRRRVSHRNRPARRSRLAGPLRRGLRDGRRPDRRGAPGPAGRPADRGPRRHPGTAGLTSHRR